MFILSKCCHYQGGLQGMFQSIQLCVCPVLPIAGKLCIPCESPTPFPVKVQLRAAEGFRQLNHAPDFLETFRNHFEQRLYQFEQSKSKCSKRCYRRRSTYYRWTTRQERITWNQPTWAVIRIPGTLIHQSLILWPSWIFSLIHTTHNTLRNDKLDKIWDFWPKVSLCYPNLSLSQPLICLVFK